MKQNPRKYLFSALIGVFIFAALPVMAAGPDDILGEWLTQDADSKILIFKCGKNKDQFCGKIIWLKEPNYPATDKEAGKPKHDRENPDASKRDRPIMGMFLVWGFKYDDGEWVDGKIYNPREGKTYSCKMTLEAPNKLKVRGFIGVSLLGKTVYWSR